MPKIKKAVFPKQGFNDAEAIMKAHAKTFALAARFLSQETRRAVACIYAICRRSDDAVDNAEGNKRLTELSEVEQDIASAYSDGANHCGNSVLADFRETVTRYSIPKQYFDELLEGMRMDLEIQRYASYDELYVYCYKVAGVIGLIALKIIASDYERTKQHAVELGIALQLPNILRYVKEDWLRGRIYLPHDELARFGVTEDNIRHGNLTRNWKALLEFQIQRARTYYKEAMKGIGFIKGRRWRFVVLVMLEMYAAILKEIERLNYDVFTHRAHVGTLGKMPSVPTCARWVKTS